MSKVRTTTPSYMIEIFRDQMSQKQMEQALVDEMLGAHTLVIYGVTLGPLAIAFLCLLPSYIGAFKRNLAAHGVSPLLPLVTHSFRTLKINYPMFFVFSILSGFFCLSPSSMVAGRFIINMAAIFGLAINFYVAMYQVTIGLLSIHRFFNNRQPIELRSPLTRKNVIVMMVLVFLMVFLRDIGCVTTIVVMFMTNKLEMALMFLYYYYMLYVAYQFILFIGMFFQFSMRSEPGTTHSENVVATHTKTIGSVKFALFIIAVISYFSGIQTLVAQTMFFSTDLFLVPVTIELTEIKANPNAIQPINNTIQPCEIKKEPIKI